MRRLLILCALASFISSISRADTIAGRTGGTLNGIQINDPEGVSWTQTGTFTNVTISAMLSAAFGNGQGTIYLTNQIGPGTAISNQIAETTLLGIAFAPNNPTLLFSDLTLGPGTYYLISSHNLGGNQIGWDYFSGAKNLPGIVGTNNLDLVSVAGPAGYPPAASFHAQDSNFEFEVATTSAATPEPSTFVLVGSGLIGAMSLAGAIHRRLRAC